MKGPPDDGDYARLDGLDAPSLAPSAIEIMDDHEDADSMLSSIYDSVAGDSDHSLLQFIEAVNAASDGEGLERVRDVLDEHGRYLAGVDARVREGGGSGRLRGRLRVLDGLAGIFGGDDPIVGELADILNGNDGRSDGGQGAAKWPAATRRG